MFVAVAGMRVKVVCIHWLPASATHPIGLRGRLHASMFLIGQEAIHVNIIYDVDYAQLTTLKL